MKKLRITLESDKISTNVNHIKNSETSIEQNISTVKRKFKKFFTQNQTVKIVVVDIQLKEGAKLIQQKAGQYRFV